MFESVRSGIDILYVTLVLHIPIWPLMLLTIDEIHFLFCWFGILTLALINFGQIMPSSVWTALAKMMLYLKFLGARISYPEILWDSWTLRLRWWLQVSILFCSAVNRHWTGPWARFWTECSTGSWPGFWTGRLFLVDSDSDVLKCIP